LAHAHDGGPITLSPNACRLLGLEGAPPDTLEGLVALCTREDQHLLRDACERGLNGSERGRFEVEVRMQVAGRLTWFRHRSDTDPDVADGPALICVIQDISREKQAIQDATEKLELMLQTERARLRAASSAGIVGVWDWYVPQNLLVWDKVMYQLYGLEEGSFGGAYEAWTNTVHPDDRAAADAAIGEALRGEREYACLFRVDWPSDGSTHYIKASSHTTYDEHGQPLRMIGINVDVTEEIARDEALREATRIAVEANMAKSDFLARMSHEIRTPMNAVIGLSALCLDLPDMPRRAADYMSRIHQSSVALMRILDSVLDFSKIEAGQMELDPQEFELKALIEASTELFALPAHQKGLQLVIDIDQALPSVLVGDSTRLSQILNNLLSNAIKFTASGQIFLSVRRRPPGDDCDARSVRMEFAVRDTGIGIAPESISELFLPFSQADESISRRYGGSGLGLVISQRLCELMGGSIQVDSQPDAGSTFSFVLVLQIARERTAAFDPSRLLYQRVLVVDDLAEERQMIVDVLEHWQVDAVQAGGGREAVDLLSRSRDSAGKPFDLVLLDWDMPEVDGLDVARWIHHSTAKGDLPRAPAVIMVTALDRDQLLLKAGDLKLDALLQKPIAASRLLSILCGSRGAGSPRVSGQPPQAQRQRAAPIAGAHVLLVEDTEDSQMVATDMLERMGLRVTVADNGLKALEVLQDTAVDIILMDVHMPEMDGLQATRLIRERQELAEVPVLAITAAALPKDREDCAAAGMAAVITKPVDPNALLDALLRWVKPRAPASINSTSVTPAAPDREDATAAPLCDGFPEIAGIDRRDAAQRLLGNATLFNGLLIAASTGLQTKMDAARSAVLRGDHAQAASQVHALRGSLYTLGAREAGALAAQVESSLRSTDPTATDLGGLGQAVTALITAIRRAQSSQTIDAPRNIRAASSDTATPTAPAVPYKAALQSLLALLEVHDVKALERWRELQPAIEAHVDAGLREPFCAAMSALNFTEAARLLRQLEATA
jgi:signal transduction histidine kinase/CheY-like chemotaxis protein/HPt (histidine-containing phosphotransfer) domain-containing protein